MTHVRPDEIKARVRSPGVPCIEVPEGDFIIDKYLFLAIAQDLAKDTLSDESAPDDAKVLAQAIMRISQALELQRLRTLDDLSTSYDQLMNRDELLAMAAAARCLPAREASYRRYCLNQRVEMTTPFVSQST